MSGWHSGAWNQRRKARYRIARVFLGVPAGKLAERCRESVEAFREAARAAGRDADAEWPELVVRRRRARPEECCPTCGRLLRDKGLTRDVRSAK